MKADSEIPHGTPLAPPRSSIWRAHDETVGLVEQAAGGRVASPARASGTRTWTRTRRSAPQPDPTERQGATEAEPVRGRHVALGDRDEAGEPRLGREQVVVARIERLRRPRGTRSRTASGSGRSRNPKSVSVNRSRRGGRSPPAGGRWRHRRTVSPPGSAGCMSRSSPSVGNERPRPPRSRAEAEGRPQQPESRAWLSTVRRTLRPTCRARCRQGRRVPP